MPLAAGTVGQFNTAPVPSPLDFWSDFAWRFARRTFGPCGTIPPAPLTVVVHSPTLRLRGWLGAPQATMDRSTSAQDRSNDDDESGVGNSEHNQPHTDTNHDEERNSDACPTRLPGRATQRFPKVSLCPLSKGPPVHGSIHARFLAPAISAGVATADACWVPQNAGLKRTTIPWDTL